MRQSLLFRATLATLVVTMVPAGWSLFAQTPTAAVVAEFQIPGADIVGLSVGGDGEIAVYDHTPGVSSSLMRFFVASLEDGLPVVTEAPETVIMGGNAPGPKGWMVRANGLLYALAETRPTTSWNRYWYHMWIHVIAGRTRIAYIDYNDTVDVAGGEPSKWPEDFWYGVNGFTVKPANVEGAHNTRLIIDDTVKGNLDILELDSTGTILVSQLRHSYRGRLEGDDCDWPDVDPNLGSYQCHGNAISGLGMALDWYLETSGSPTNPLATTDDLYVLDPNDPNYETFSESQSHLRRFELSHPGVDPISVTEAVPGIDISADTLGYGANSLHAAPSTDRIWIATGTQSENPVPKEGIVPVLDTLSLTTHRVNPVNGDRHVILVDPVDQNHIIIPVADLSVNPSTLILRELQNGVVINSVTALTDFDGYSLKAAAYDPLFGIVYLAIGDMLWAVAATAPTLEIFSDGFESGNTSKWSTTSK